MIRPFKGLFALTQGFGEHPADYARFGMKGHNGLDYGLPSGTEVTAPHAGRVIEATSDPMGYGNYLKIENDKEGSVLAHLQSFKVSVGQSVTEEQVVGISDNTGNSTGPHLHWGYYLFPRDRQNGYAGFIDQLGLIGKESVPMNDTKKAVQFDRIVTFLNQISVLPTNKSEDYLDNDKLLKGVQDLSAENKRKEEELRQIKGEQQQVVDLKLKLNKAKVKATEIVNL